MGNDRTWDNTRDERDERDDRKDNGRLPAKPARTSQQRTANSEEARPGVSTELKMKFLHFITKRARLDARRKRAEEAN